VIRHTLFGAAHIDRIGVFSGAALPGKSNPGTVRETVGGAALNVASSLAALGAQVSLSSAISTDEAGAQICRIATERRIKLQALPCSAVHPTATYTALLGTDGELIIALADMEIYAAAIVEQAVIAGEDWLTVDANLPADAIGALLQKPSAHVAGMTVSAAKAGRLRPHLDRLDLLFTNRAEAAALVDAPVDEPLETLARTIAARGCRRAVISDGERPLAVIDNGAFAELSVAGAAVVDVTGAGDALAAGTLFALGKGASFIDAVQTGIAASHAVLARRGSYRGDLADLIGITP